MNLDPRVSLITLGVFFFLVLLSSNLIIQLSIILLLGFCYWNLTSTRQLVKIMVFLVVPTIFIIILNWIFVSKELFHIVLMVLRFWGLSWLFNWFLKQVEPDELAKALWAFHFPYRIAWQISLAYRFIPMFQEESQRIYQIQISRGIPLDRGILLRLRYLSSISIPLLVMTQDKANLFAEALFARNWNSKTPKSLLNPLKMHSMDWFLLSIVLSSLLLLYI
ncbi:MAG: energy-coupling factor transporter transmembrane component T [Candidatus Hodarchaeota archaeon]